MGKVSLADWQLEVELVKLKGKPRYMWTAVDADGQVLDLYVTETHDEVAARQFFEQALKDPWAKLEIRSGASTRRRK